MKRPSSSPLIRCHLCGETIPLDDFNRLHGGRYGYGIQVHVSPEDVDKVSWWCGRCRITKPKRRGR